MTAILASNNSNASHAHHAGPANDAPRQHAGHTSIAATPFVLVKDPMRAILKSISRQLPGKQHPLLWTLSTQKTEPAQTVANSQVEAKEKAVPLASDVTVEELYHLIASGKFSHIMVLLNAPWCGPCKAMKTEEYQASIHTYNATHPDERLVTLNVDNPHDSFSEIFWDKVGTYKKTVGYPPKEVFSQYLPMAVYIDGQGQTFLTGPVISQKKGKAGIVAPQELMTRYRQYEQDHKDKLRPFPKIIKTSIKP